MPNPVVATTLPQIQLPPSGTSLSLKATVTTSVRTLGEALVAAGNVMPAWTRVANSTQNNFYPAQVTLTLADPQEDAIVTATLDGNTDPTNADPLIGYQIGVPFQGSQLFRNDVIRLISDTADTDLTCNFLCTV